MFQNCNEKLKKLCILTHTRTHAHARRQRERETNKCILLDFNKYEFSRFSSMFASTIYIVEVLSSNLRVEK